MVVARIEGKPEGLCAGDEFQEVSFGLKGPQSSKTSQGLASQISTPLREGVRRPHLILVR